MRGELRLLFHFYIWVNALKTPPYMRIKQYFKMEDFIMSELLIVTAIVVAMMLIGVAYDCVIEMEMEEMEEEF